MPEFYPLFTPCWLTIEIHFELSTFTCLQHCLWYVCVFTEIQLCFFKQGVTKLCDGWEMQLKNVRWKTEYKSAMNSTTGVWGFFGVFFPLRLIFISHTLLSKWSWSVHCYTPFFYTLPDCLLYIFKVSVCLCFLSCHTVFLPSEQPRICLGFNISGLYFWFWIPPNKWLAICSIVLTAFGFFTLKVMTV